MKRKVFLTVMILMLVGLLTIGCGATVPQEEHDQVVADLAACQDEVESVKREAQSQVAATEAQLNERQSDLEATQAELADLQARVDEAAVASEILSVFVDLALSGEELSNEDAMAAFLEVGINVYAGRLEKQADVMIMNRCHGFWAVGITRLARVQMP